jgi:hypothetical protein
MQKLIFLDIDGPMIPSGMSLIHPHASWKRMLSPICVAVLKEMLKKSDAYLVTNSTHNVDLNGEPSIRDVLISYGIPDEAFHRNWKTDYPDVSRDVAVKKWLAENGEYDWIALDDARFMEDTRVVYVDFDTGLTPAHYNEVAEMWGLPEIIILG